MGAKGSLVLFGLHLLEHSLLILGQPILGAQGYDQVSLLDLLFQLQDVLKLSQNLFLTDRGLIKQVSYDSCVSGGGLPCLLDLEHVCQGGWFTVLYGPKRSSAED